MSLPRTDLDEQDIISRFLAGETLESLRKNVGAGRRTITRIIANHGIDTMLNDPRGRARRFRQDHGEEVGERYSKGESIGVLAEEFDIDRHIISSVVYGLGLRCENKRNISEIDEKRIKKNSMLNCQFGISLKEYEDIIFSVQGGKCAFPMCDKLAPSIDEMLESVFWHVDHDHRCCSGRKSCGKCIRGITCHGCNVILASQWEDLEWRAQALKYLDSTLGE